MMTRIIVLILTALALTACQSIPKERKNNCACAFDQISIIPQGDVA